MKKTVPLLSLLIFFSCCIHAQTFSPEEVDRQMKTMSDEEKIEFIHSNFYKIYSADLPHAARLTQLSTELSHKNGWKDKEAYGLVYQGVAAFLQGDYKKALPFYNRAIDLFDSLDHHDGLALAHNEIAVFFGRHRDNPRAFQHLELSMKYSVASNNLEQLGTSLGHQATLLEREGKIEEADKIYRRIYEIRLETSDSVGLGYILLDLAMGEQRKKNLQGALDYIHQSTVIRRKINDQQGLAINVITMGDAYAAFQQYRKAIDYYKEGIEEARRINYADLVRFGYDQLSQAYLNIKDFESAYFAQRQAHAFNDSLFNLERARVIADMQTKYETDKKQQEIELQRVTVGEQEAELQRNFVIIISLVITLVLLVIIFLLVRARMKRKEELLKKEHDLTLRDGLIRASIQSQEAERKRFAQDLHDGMGQLISSLRLSVSSLGGKELTTEQRINIFSKSEKILQEMHREIRGIAFNLMPQTLIQSGLIPALEEMAERINESGEIIVKVNGFDIPERLDEVQEISLYRVIQEWISNVIKYAGASSIEVQLVGYENEITIMVEDNGKGFDPAVLEKGRGHGWRNIQSRLNLIKSQIEVDSREGVKGTTIVIHLPYDVKLRASGRELSEQISRPSW